MKSLVCLNVLPLLNRNLFPTTFPHGSWKEEISPLTMEYHFMKSAAKWSAVGCSHLVTLMEPLFTSPVLPQHFPGSVCACESSLHQVRLRCELSHYSAQAICFSFKASTQIFSFSSIIFIQFSENLVVFSAKKKMSMSWKWAEGITGITVCPFWKGLGMTQWTLWGLYDFIVVWAAYLSINQAVL